MTTSHYEIIVKGRKTGAILSYNAFGNLHSIGNTEGIELGEWDSFMKHLLPKSTERLNSNACDWVAFREISVDECFKMITKTI